MPTTTYSTSPTLFESKLPLSVSSSESRSFPQSSTASRTTVTQPTSTTRTTTNTLSVAPTSMIETTSAAQGSASITSPNASSTLTPTASSMLVNVTQTTLSSSTTSPTISLTVISSSTTITRTVEQTTDFPWPTGETTKTLPSGEIILSESLIAYSNCTTVLLQLILNPATNTTRTEVTTDEKGCKATSISTPNPLETADASTVTTTTFSWPTGATKKLMTGEIILSEALIAYKNCTTVLKQLILNPVTNTTRVEVVSDSQGCKKTTTPMFSASGISDFTSTNLPSKTQLSTGASRVQRSDSLPSQTPRSLASGPSVTSSTTPSIPLTTAGPVMMCPFPKINLDYTTRPTKEERKKYYDVGEKVVHLCQRRYVFEVAKQPYKVYTCKENGQWSNQYEKCIADKVGVRVKREL